MSERADSAPVVQLIPSVRPIADEAVEPLIRSSEILFTAHIQTLVRETFDYNGADITRDFVEHPGAVAVLALDDEDRVLAIQQYRHPIRSREWEIPAGLLDVAGEPLLEAAARELAEEADLAAAEWGILADVATTPGGSNEIVRVFLARGLTATAEVFEREDEEADIAVRWIALDELVDAIAAGTVHNSLLIAGVLAAFAARARGWQSVRSV